MNTSFNGLAIGIGSLPFLDCEKAVDAVLNNVSRAPFWPQLPKSGPQEGMIAQYSENLPGLKMTASGLTFNPDNLEKGLEIFYDRFIANDLEYFKISEDFARGLYAFYRRLEKSDLSGVEFIKCQVTGPFTFCFGITEQSGKAIYHDEILRQAMIKGLTMKALWQLNLFKKFGKKFILFFDEPFLTGVGSAYTPVDRKDVIEIFTEITGNLKGQDCLSGVHCCGNTDWSMFMETEGIDIINFDSFEYVEKFLLYAENLKDYLKRGGVICWGIVPTQGYDGTQNAKTLAGKIDKAFTYLIKKGIDRNLLFERLMISPACGLGALETSKAEKILNLLKETSAFIGQK